MQWENKETVSAASSATGAKKNNVRWMVVAVLFFVTLINYADRASISLAGPGRAGQKSWV